MPSAQAYHFPGRREKRIDYRCETYRNAAGEFTLCRRGRHMPHHSTPEGTFSHHHSA
jgi:hypothetical protein